MKKILCGILIIGLLYMGFVYAEEVHRSAKLTDIRGEVMVRKAGTDTWTQGEKDMILSEEDEIKTGMDGFATLVFDEKGSFEAEKPDSIDIHEDTELFISQARYDDESGVKSTLLSLNLGKIVANASRLTDESKFEVETPTTIVGVRGTKYVVEYRP